MVNVGELENFLNDSSAKDNDMCEILPGAVINDKEDAVTKRKYKELLLNVKLNGTRDLQYAPNKDAREVLTKAFGSDTDKWTGKKFTVKIYPKTSFGVTKNAILPVLIKEVKV
jgi:hypothetical protein